MSKLNKKLENPYKHDKLYGKTQNNSVRSL